LAAVDSSTSLKSATSRPTLRRRPISSRNSPLSLLVPSDSPALLRSAAAMSRPRAPLASSSPQICAKWLDASARADESETPVSRSERDALLRRRASSPRSERERCEPPSLLRRR